jgi:hypothetical protein
MTQMGPQMTQMGLQVTQMGPQMTQMGLQVTQMGPQMTQMGCRAGHSSRRMRNMRNTTCGWLLIALLGCGREKAADPAPPQPPAPMPTPATIALPDFKHLAYLHGDWHGRMTDGKSFYERYRLADDSTIVSYSITDSTFSPPTDSGQIHWSNGQVRSGGDNSSYVATIWTPDSVRFEPERGAANSFVWIRKSADAWEARLESRGRPAPVIYQMTRAGS